MNDLILYRAALPESKQAERIVKRGFWDKVRRTAGKLPFVEDAVAAWFCATDPRSPVAVKATLIAALAYFVMPADVIPDFVAGLGYSDDAAVLLGAIKMVHGHITRRHRARAAEVLLKEFAPEEPRQASAERAGA
jgi:uncharacterized membrane protein YkvA (DUF1232 family)